MSNLSDLLPAGAAAKQLTFTDSGSGISSKAPVVLNSDGTVSPIAIGSDSAGTPTYFSGGSDSKTQGGMASNGSGEILYAYRANNGYGTVQVVNYATPGGSITYGTPVTFLSSSTGGLSCAYDTQSGYYVIAYTNSGSNFVGECRCVSVSGTTPTVYSASSLSSYPYQVNNTDLEYDPTQQMTFLAYDYIYDDGSSFFYGGAYVRLVQPSSAYNPPTLHGAQDAEGSGSSTFLGRASMVYDPSVSKTVIHFCNVSANAFSKIMSVSSTTISFSANTAFHSGYTTNPTATYDSNQNAQVVAFRDSSNKGYVVAGTTGASSLTYGTDVEFGDGNQVHSDSNAFGVAYDANAQKVVIVYADDDDSDNGKVVFATVSGTAVTVTTPIYLDGSSGTPVRMFASVYDATGKRVIVSYTLNSNDSTYNNAVEPGATNLTTANFVGVADSAISASAAGSIIVQGGTVSGLTDPFGTVSLTLASPDTTSGNGQKENVSMAYDSNADRTILVYRDGGDSDKVKAIVGTLTGTSMSWGTPVEVLGNTGGAQGMCVAYDASAQRVLVGYNDSNNSNYLYLRVGEISGTSVTFGTPVSPASHSSYNPNLSYDTADQKLLLVYANADDSYKPYGAACTITGGTNSVVATTPASLTSRNAYDPFGLAYNANDGKHLLDITDNTSTGYAYVVTMSSGSISVGAEASYSPGFTPRQSICVYDSSAQKIVRAYYSNSSPYPVSAAVASISGTNVSFGTAATAFTTNSGTRFHGTFDSSSNQVGFVSRTYSTNYIQTNFGSVSGTAITFGTETNVYSGGTASTNYNISYDSTAQKLVYVYGGATYDSVVGTLGATTFTTGTKYYVTSTGGFSSSADTPSVNAGLAISTTSLLLNGDS